MAAKQSGQRIVFGITTCAGGILGFLIGSASQPYLDGLSPITRQACWAAFTILGMVMGILSTRPMSEVYLNAAQTTSSSLETLQVSEMVMGSLGLLVGLGVAFFVSLAIQTLNITSLPTVGPWLGPGLILASAIVFAWLGAFLGFRLGHVRSIREFFDPKSAPLALPQVLIDTSIIVDGRLGAVLQTGFLTSALVVPQFVLGELQWLADSEDPLKRLRGRRGLDFLEDLRSQFPFEVIDDEVDGQGADQKLVKLARQRGASLLTNDYNLQKVAAVQGVVVLNLNQLATALKPAILPGQMLNLQLQREGKESHQAVAFFEDGTMVVVERGRPHLGREVVAEVTSVMQTATGKMVFAKFRQVAEPQESP